jgi:O-antigen/teichoic acid export membrane protein
VTDLKKKILFQSLLAVSQLIFPLATFPYLTRTLGAAGLGKTGYIEFVAGLIITVFSVGIPYYGVREISKARNDKQKRSRLCGELLCIHFICSLFGILIFIILLQLNPNYQKEKQLMMLGSLYILLQVFSFEWYLQGTEAFRFLAWRNILVRVLGIAAIFLLVKDVGDYIIYYGIILVTQLVVAFTAFIKLIKENTISFRAIQFKPHLKPLFYFFLTSSFISVYIFFDTIILGWLTGKDHVGYYTFALRIVKLPLLLLLTLNTILFPRISFLHTEGQHERIAALTRFTLKFIFTITIPVCVCFYMLAPEIIAILGGIEFSPSIIVLQILSPLPLMISLSNFFVLQVLTPVHKERFITIAYMVASLISLLLNFLLIPVMQERGAAIAILITESAIFILLFYFSINQVKTGFPVNNLFVGLVLSLLAIPVVLFVRNSLNSSLYILILSLGSFGSIYFILQYFFLRNEVMTAITNFSLNLFRREQLAKTKKNELSNHGN